MTSDIVLALVQDGVVQGALYALLALSLVLVFATTRVILIPQGEFVAFGALTYASLDAGTVPGSLWLSLALGVAAAMSGLWQERRWSTRRGVLRLLAESLGPPLLAVALVPALAARHPGVAVQALLSLLVVAPMGGSLHRLAFQPLGRAGVLALLIAAVGSHLALLGLGLAAFGPDGVRASGFSDAVLSLGPLVTQGQSLWVLGSALALMAALALFFGLTLPGKALRAVAVNRIGAQLVGVGTAGAGRAAFSLAALIGALTGVLAVPLTTMYYDTGFLLGLKGFVAAIVGGLVSYPLAVAAALLLGVVESFAAFWASSFQQAIVFALVLPVLLWRSLRAGTEEE